MSAESFYPTMAGDAAPEGKPAAEKEGESTPEKSAAEILFGASMRKPEAKPAEGDAANQDGGSKDGEDGESKKQAASMYDSAKMYALDLKESLDNLADHFPEFTPEVRESTLQDVVEVAQALEISPSKMAPLYTLHARYLREQPTEETMTEWCRESRELVRRRYGDEMPERLESVKAMLDSMPKLRDALIASGTMNHPDVAAKLFERAGRSASRWQPKPKA